MQHVLNRLNYVNDRKLYPAIAEQKIVKPIFIIGLGRTGSTILHDILAQGSGQPRAADLGGDLSVAAAPDGDLRDRSPYRPDRGRFSADGFPAGEVQGDASDGG